MRDSCLVEGCERKMGKCANYCNYHYKKFYVKNEPMLLGNKELTDRQAEIYQYLVSTLLNEHYVPGPSAIARHFGFRPNCAQGHVDALVAKGFVEGVKGVKVGQFRLPHVQLKQVA